MDVGKWLCGLVLCVCACSDQATFTGDLQVRAASDMMVNDTPDLLSCLAVADESLGIFVSPSGTDNSSCGTEVSPCATLQYGVDRAGRIGKAYVFATPGTYLESVVLTKGVTIVGGWNHIESRWQRICPGDPALVQIVGGEIAVKAFDLGGAAALESITINSGNSQNDRSSYGVFAVGMTTNLSLHNVVVEAHDGSPGGNGAAPPAAGPPSAAGSCASTPTAPGTTGAPGADGASAMMGTFDREGYHPGDGLGGSPGALGGNGSVGAPGTSNNCSLTCVLDSNSSTGCSASPPTSATGCPGKAGCGGPGGAGGAGGQGGGSSIALFAFDAQVTVTDSHLVAGNGGRGGSGTSGASGGSASNGATGAPVYCNSQCALVPILNGGYCAAGMSFAIPGGTATAGAAGGRGGQGGAAAGGWSIAVVQLGAAVVNTTNTQLQHGRAGVGGSVPAAGHDGMAADVYP